MWNKTQCSHAKYQFVIVCYSLCCQIFKKKLVYKFCIKLWQVKKTSKCFDQTKTMRDLVENFHHSLQMLGSFRRKRRVVGATLRCQEQQVLQTCYRLHLKVQRSNQQNFIGKKSCIKKWYMKHCTQRSHLLIEPFCWSMAQIHVTKLKTN